LKIYRQSPAHKTIKMNLSDYTNFTFSQLIGKIDKARFFNLPKMVAEALRKIPSTPAYEPKYKVYTAIIKQEGTDAPTFNVLENTLGLTFTSIRSSPGSYLLTPNIEFPIEKTTLDIGTPHPDANTNTFKFQYTLIQGNSSEIRLNTFFASTSTWTQGDDAIRYNLFEIRVYN
jgi:hypothetical protein